MTSRLSRRISVARSASGDGVSPACSSRARMKRSIGLRTQFADFTTGGTGRRGGRNAQWVAAGGTPGRSPASPLAPWSIQS